MKSNLKILIVEDSEDQQNLYSDAVEDFNKESSVNIEIQFAESSSKANSLLNSELFDAAFIDLVLSSESDDSGNTVIKNLLESSDNRLIVFVVSGTLETLEHSYHSVFTNPIFQKFDRTVETKEILKKLVSIYKSGITKIFGKQGSLEKQISKIFLNHLSKNFDFWLEKNVDCSRELLRWTTLHLLEYLDLPAADDNESDNAKVKYFESEFYIFPPIRKFFSTGDLIKKDEKMYILLSPSCDISVREIVDDAPKINVESLVIAECIALEETAIGSKNISYKKWSEFSRNLKNNAKNRFHFLPKYLEIREHIIDFKRLENIPAQDYASYTRIATVSMPFVRDIQSRFSSYFARQGQPEGQWL